MAKLTRMERFHASNTEQNDIDSDNAIYPEEKNEGIDELVDMFRDKLDDNFNDSTQELVEKAISKVREATGDTDNTKVLILNRIRDKSIDSSFDLDMMDRMKHNAIRKPLIYDEVTMENDKNKFIDNLMEKYDLDETRDYRKEFSILNDKENQSDVMNNTNTFNRPAIFDEIEAEEQPEEPINALEIEDMKVVENDTEFKTLELFEDIDQVAFDEVQAKRDIKSMRVDDELLDEEGSGKLFKIIVSILVLAIFGLASYLAILFLGIEIF